MIQFQREPVTSALIIESLPMLKEHWKEVAHFEDIPLDVDGNRYLEMEACGVLRCYTARDSKQVLVGYALFVVNPNPHYKTSLQAAQDVLYIDPAHRGITSFKFIRWCDEQLQAEGVQAVYHHSKAAHDFGKLLQAQGYELVDLIYAKRLDDRVMGQDWTEQAQHDYDTARFVGVKP